MHVHMDIHHTYTELLATCTQTKRPEKRHPDSNSGFQRGKVCSYDNDYENTLLLPKASKETEVNMLSREKLASWRALSLQKALAFPILEVPGNFLHKPLLG